MKLSRPWSFAMSAVLAIGLTVGVAAPANADHSTRPEPAGNRTPVEVCHATPPATAAQGWNRETPDASSVLAQGHGEHAADVIPAFTWWERVGNGHTQRWEQRDYPGKNLSTVFADGRTGQQVLDSDCAGSNAAPLLQASVEYSITPATCDDGEILVLGPAVNATFGIPNITEGPGDFSVIATANAGAEFKNGKTTDEIKGKLKGPSTGKECDPPLLEASAGYTVTPATCENGEIAVLGTPVNATFGPTSLLEGPGLFTVTATADAGAAFAGGGTTLVLSETLDGPLSGPQCDPPLVAAFEYSLTLATCDAGAKIRIDTATNVTYSVSLAEGPGNYTITITADPGAAFPGGGIGFGVAGVLDGPLTGPQCAPPLVASAGFTITPATCEDGETVVLDTPVNATLGVPSLLEGPGQFTVTATADTGAAFAGGGSTLVLSETLDGPLTGAQCGPPLLEASADYTVTPATCDDGEKVVLGTPVNATFGLPSLLEGPGVFTVTATADTGAAFPGGGTTLEFRETLDGPLTGPQCAPALIASFDYTVTPATCDDGDTLLILDATNVTYSATLNEGPGDFVLTVTAVPGAAFPGGATLVAASGSLGGPLTGPQCQSPLEVASATFSTTPATCDDGEKVVLGTPVNATLGTPSLLEGPGEFTVTATADTGAAFAGGATTLELSKTLGGKLTGPQCDPPRKDVASAAVSTIAATCYDGEILVLGTPVNAAFGAPSLTEGPGEYEVTATANTGAEFAGGATTLKLTGSLDGPLTGKQCDHKPHPDKARAKIRITDPTCDAPAMLILRHAVNASWGAPTRTAGPGHFEVTATAEKGAKFRGGASTRTFEGHLAGELTGPECDDGHHHHDMARAKLSVTEATCDAPAELVLGKTVNATWGTPTRTEGPGHFEVTATAEDGAKFRGGATTRTFEGYLAGELTGKECRTPVPPVIPEGEEPEPRPHEPAPAGEGPGTGSPDTDPDTDADTDTEDAEDTDVLAATGHEADRAAGAAAVLLLLLGGALVTTRRLSPRRHG
jgi:hypothetical protein